MEVMEDGNLVDKVHILIQRDLNYYREHHCILQNPICTGVVGGHSDFPLFASFASTKLVLWWEEEFLAGFHLTSGLIKRLTGYQDQEHTNGGGDIEIVKSSDPHKFSELIITSSEQILGHLHVLTQEALDHADLPVLTGTIGAISLLKNCVWLYVKKCKENGLPNEVNDLLIETWKKFEEMKEAVAERLLDLHCRLLSLYILQDPDCLNWGSEKAFFELERGSYTIQMWWIYMRGTKDDLWKTYPPDLARRVFAGMLNDTLTILTVRYCQASPSICRNQLLVDDIANILFCVSSMLPAICSSLDELIGFSVSPQNKILNDIHVKFKELFFCFLLRSVPLEILYKIFRKNLESLTIFKPVVGLSPWIMFGLPHLYSDNPSSVKHVSDLQDNIVIFLEITILLAQPQPNWSMLLKILCMRKGLILSLLLKMAITNSATTSIKQTTKKSKQCEGLLCQGDGSCAAVNLSNSLNNNTVGFGNLTSSLTYVILLMGNSSDLTDVLIPAIENETEWSRHFDKRQIWSQNRPAWLNAILELANPILPAVANTVLLAVKTGATMYQAMSIIIGCFIQMWVCIAPKLSMISNLLQEAIDPVVNPLGGSVLLQILITALYSKLLEMSKENENHVSFSKYEKADPKQDDAAFKHLTIYQSTCKQDHSLRSFDETSHSDEMILLTIAEGVCSIDEDDKHTEEIGELLKQADLHLEGCKDSNIECFTKVEEGDQVREVLTSGILLTNFGKESLKVIYSFLKCNDEWIFDNLHLGPLLQSSKINLSLPPCEPLLYSMFHINGKQFDEALSRKLQPDWKKLLCMCMSLTPEKVWTQISKRPEFKEEIPPTSHVYFMTSTLRNILKGK